MTLDDVEAAWDEVFDALPAAWSVGRPSYEDEPHEGTRYAFDSVERPSVGVRSREWTSVDATGLECLREMARRLRELGAGRVQR